MSKLQYFIFILLLFISTKVLSQDSLNQIFINQKYKGGTELFKKEISSKLYYPKSALMNNYYTIVIVYIEIGKEGILKYIEVLNRLSYGIGKEIEKVFLTNNQNWQSSESDYSFYLSITYSLYDNYAKIINVKYPKIISENILVIAYNVGEDSLIREKVNYRKTFQKYENAFNKNINKGYYNKAKSYLNKLLTMDCFYQSYYQSRINIETYTKSYDYICGDLKILKLFWNIKVKKVKVKCN